MLVNLTPGGLLETTQRKISQREVFMSPVAPVFHSVVTVIIGLKTNIFNSSGIESFGEQDQLKPNSRSRQLTLIHLTNGGKA